MWRYPSLVHARQTAPSERGLKPRIPDNFQTLLCWQKNLEHCVLTEQKIVYYRRNISELDRTLIPKLRIPKTNIMFPAIWFKPLSPTEMFGFTMHLNWSTVRVSIFNGRSQWYLDLRPLNGFHHHTFDKTLLCSSWFIPFIISWGIEQPWPFIYITLISVMFII